MGADHNHAVHCSLVAVDITGFGDLRRDDEVQLYVRKALYEVLREAFDQSGVGWHDCYRQDRGDGVLIVVPPTVPVAVLVDPLIDLVQAGLRHHNKMSSDAAQIRLRMALHTGSVLFDSHGVTGHALTRLFNLLDAPLFKSGFTGTTSELGLVTSEYVYDDVIRHCSRLIDAATYDPIEVTEDQTATRAWVHMPPGPAGRGGARVPRMRSAPASPHGVTDMRDVRDITRAVQ